MIDPEYGTARNDAGRRHNLALLGHKAQPRSSGIDLGMDCDCGLKATMEGYHRHVVEIIEVCMRTPMPTRRTE